MHSLNPKGRHGDDVRRAVGVWPATQGGEVWAIQHLHQAGARMGSTAVASKDSREGQTVLF